MEEGWPQNRRRLHRISQGSGGRVLRLLGASKTKVRAMGTGWRQRTGERQSVVRDYRPTAPNPLQPLEYPTEPLKNLQNPAYKPF
jgi:hypothetical protein